MFLITTGSQQGSKYLVSAQSIFTLWARHPTVLKLKYIIFNFAVLRKVIRKAKEMYWNELLSSCTNKSKKSWNIINNEIGTQSCF